MQNIKEVISPMSKSIVLTEKIKDLFNEAKVVKAFVFFIPSEDEGEVNLFDNGMCGHELIRLADHLKAEAKERLEEDPHEDNTSDY
jgi:hypothetical protein